MANIVYIATSLDGYIAGPDGELDWLMEFPNPGNSDFGFKNFISGIDAVVMGRNTFEMVASFDEWAYESPVFVFSSSLADVPDRLKGKAEIISGSPEAVIQILNDRGFNNLYIDGGKTIQSFMQAGLIDELILTRLPTLLGEGIPLFGKLDQPQPFDVQKTETFENGMVQTHYCRKR